MGKIMRGENKASIKSKKQKKQAFIFTMDALLVLPLILLIISSLIAFSITLKENILIHEYTYMLAKDSLTYLSELKMSEASIPTLSLSDDERGLSVVGYISKNIDNRTRVGRAINGALKLPENAGYVFEYFNTSSGNWERLAIGNPSKFADENHTFEVPAVKVITALSDPYITVNSIVVNGPGADYLAGYDCAANITCQVPISVYEPGSVLGPDLFRIRVYV